MNKAGKVGKITIAIDRKNYRLRFTHLKKRHSLTVGEVSEEGFKLATAKAQEINSDILMERFDPTLAKYSPERANALEILEAQAKLNLHQVWDNYKKLKENVVQPSTKKHCWSQTERCMNSVDSRSLSVELKTEKGVDYTQLRDFLAAGKWKEADEETGKVMFQATGRTSEGWLRKEDIDNFPCEDLRTINQLWLHYSSGKFGFSVQKEIYESLGGTREYNEEVWKKFCDRVGWRKGGSWLSYSDLTFNLELAPQAHLPALCRMKYEWLLNFRSSYDHDLIFLDHPRSSTLMEDEDSL